MMKKFETVLHILSRKLECLPGEYKHRGEGRGGKEDGERRKEEEGEQK